jgi:hypothetical protein
MYLGRKAKADGNKDDHTIKGVNQMGRCFNKVYTCICLLSYRTKSNVHKAVDGRYFVCFCFISLQYFSLILRRPQW